MRFPDDNPRRARPRGLPVKAAGTALVFCLSVLWLAGCGGPEVANRYSSGTTIVCFGDSLTSGFGADPGHDYPSVLRAKVNWPVINAGVPGDTTRDALRRVDRDVLPHHPRLVIITLGGNDVLQGISHKETLANMRTIIDKIKGEGAMVVWATVKTGLVLDPSVKEDMEMARQERIILIPDVLKDTMFNPRTKHDQVHPNNAGYELMAERIYERIQGLLN